ncbi:MAG: ankyrin repeat domain-containing protein [Legionellaceae bacterium]|nr:ankyrin repeat domain-containing protein [Legionellaceae bacterium]
MTQDELNDLMRIVIFILEHDLKSRLMPGVDPKAQISIKKYSHLWKSFYYTKYGSLYLKLFQELHQKYPEQKDNYVFLKRKFTEIFIKHIQEDSLTYTYDENKLLSLDLSLWNEHERGSTNILFRHKEDKNRALRWPLDLLDPLMRTSRRLKIWNYINPKYPAKDLGVGIEVPFFENTSVPTQQQCHDLLIELYREKRVLIADAYITGNIVKLESGEVICLDEEHCVCEDDEPGEQYLQFLYKTGKYEELSRVTIEENHIIASICTIIYLRNQISPENVKARYVREDLIDVLYAWRQVDRELTVFEIEKLILELDNPQYMDEDALVIGDITYAEVCLSYNVELINQKFPSGKTPLEIVINHCDNEMILLFYKHGAVQLDAVRFYYNIVHYFAETGNLDNFKECLDKDRNVLDLPDKFHQTPLLWAVSRGHYSFVRFLVEQGANLDVQTITPNSSALEHGRTLFSWALEGGYFDIFRFLSKEQENRHQPGLQLCSVLPSTFISLLKKRNVKNIIEQIQKDKSLLYKSDAQGRTPLHLAAEMGLGETVDFLISMGANIDILTLKNQSAMEIAIENDNCYCAIVLYRAGALEPIAKPHTMHLIHVIVIFGDIELLERCLATYPELLDLQDEKGLTPLHYAVNHCVDDIVKYLLSLKAQVNVYSNAGETAFDLSISRGAVEITLALYKNAYPIVKPSQLHGCMSAFARKGMLEEFKKCLEKEPLYLDLPLNGKTPLSLAISNGRIEFVRFLVEQGVSLEEKTPSDGFKTHEKWISIYELACIYRHFDILNILRKEQAIRYQAKLQVNSELPDELKKAVVEKNFKYIKSQIEQDKSLLYKTDENGKNPLHIASELGNTEIVKYLMSLGADVDILTQEHQSAMDLAMSGDNGDIAVLLFISGAKMSVYKSGITNLAHMFTRLRDLKCLKKCLEMHPELLDLQNEDGFTLLHLAIIRNFAAFDNLDDMLEYILSLNPNVNLVTKEGVSALDMALENSDNIKIAMLLYKHGAFVPKAVPGKDHLVHIFARHGKLLYLEGCIHANPLLVDLEDSNGQTLLDLAIDNGRTETVRFLFSMTQKIRNDQVQEIKNMLSPTLSIELLKNMRSKQIADNDHTMNNFSFSIFKPNPEKTPGYIVYTCYAIAMRFRTKYWYERKLQEKMQDEQEVDQLLTQDSDVIEYKKYYMRSFDNLPMNIQRGWDAFFDRMDEGVEEAWENYREASRSEVYKQLNIFAPKYENLSEEQKSALMTVRNQILEYMSDAPPDSVTLTI